MNFSELKFRSWVDGTIPIDDAAVSTIKNFGKYLAPVDRRDKEAISTSQIRKFFGDLKRIHSSFEKYKDEVPFLSAKLAYATGRALKQCRTSKMKAFYEQLNNGITAVDGDEKKFDRLVKLVEATVAFHKFHGGND